MVGKIGSDLEAKMLYLIRVDGLPEPVLQYKACKSVGRLWEFDQSWVEYKVALEIQGGIYMKKGAHNTGPAIIRDCEKGNIAQLLGWIVLHVTEPQMDNGLAVLWIRQALLLRGWR